MASANSLSHTVGGDLGAQLDARGIHWYRYGEAIAYTTAAWADTAARTLFTDVDGQRRPPGPADELAVQLRGRRPGPALERRRTFGTVVLDRVARHQRRPLVVHGHARRSGDDVTWSWTGADVPLQTHTAGLRDYDVQYRVGSGSWHDDRGTTRRRRRSPLRDRPSGASYGVRVRATDRRGNAGAWTADAHLGALP